MIENHPLQLLGILSWNDLEYFNGFIETNSQVEGINYITKKGLAIIDQPKPLYERNKNTNSVFISHKGEATVEELKKLSKHSKERTFLSYNGMMPPHYLPPFINFHKNAEQLSKLTGLKLFGGSDTILNENSLFSSYNHIKTNNIEEILENPKLIEEIFKGTLPLYHLERYQRILAAIYEEYIYGLKKREKIHSKMIEKFLVES